MAILAASSPTSGHQARRQVDVTLQGVFQAEANLGEQSTARGWLRGVGEHLHPQLSGSMPSSCLVHRWPVR
jgi:hypothetical protein